MACGLAGLCTKGAIMAEPFRPLEECHCDNLDAAIRAGADVRECLEKCKQAGWLLPDIEEQEKQNTGLANGFKRAFFPHRP